MIELTTSCFIPSCWCQVDKRNSIQSLDRRNQATLLGAIVQRSRTREGDCDELNGQNV